MKHKNKFKINSNIIINQLGLFYLLIFIGIIFYPMKDVIKYSTLCAFGLLTIFNYISLRIITDIFGNFEKYVDNNLVNQNNISFGNILSDYSNIFIVKNLIKSKIQSNLIDNFNPGNVINYIINIDPKDANKFWNKLDNYFKTEIFNYLNKVKIENNFITKISYDFTPKETLVKMIDNENMIPREFIEFSKDQEKMIYLYENIKNHFVTKKIEKYTNINFNYIENKKIKKLRLKQKKEKENNKLKSIEKKEEKTNQNKMKVNKF